MRDITNGWADAICYLTTGKLEATPRVDKEVYVTQLPMGEVVSYFMTLKNKTPLTKEDKEKTIHLHGSISKELKQAFDALATL